jgi:hypothetical protein
MPMPDGLRSLPYLVHTNRELGLMLQGLKPLAIFSWIEGYEVDCVQRYLRMFDRHVRLGRFGKHELTLPVPQLPHLRHCAVRYTLPGEEWRVEALDELFNQPRPWTAEHERRFGELLGYEDWQNDIWLGNGPHRSGS